LLAPLRTAAAARATAEGARAAVAAEGARAAAAAEGARAAVAAEGARAAVAAGARPLGFVVAAGGFALPPVEGVLAAFGVLFLMPAVAPLLLVWLPAFLPPAPLALLFFLCDAGGWGGEVSTMQPSATGYFRIRHDSIRYRLWYLMLLWHIKAYTPGRWLISCYVELAQDTCFR